MKKLIPFLFVLCGLQAFSQTDPNEKAILKVLADQNAAWNRGDVDAFMKGYWENDSLMFIGQSGVTYGYNRTLQNYKRNYPDTAHMGQLVFDIIQVKKLSAEYYHVTGKWSLHRPVGDVSGHFTLVFRRIKGQWVIISDHSS